MDFRASKVEKFDCGKCGGRIDASRAPSLSRIACPNCGQTADVPALFDRYLLSKQLGRGGGGVVFQALDTQLHRQVAVKVLLSEDDQEQIARQCIREAQMLATINHRNIVSIYALGEYKGQHYMVMELLTGGDLRQFAEPGQTLSEREALTMISAVAQALRAAQRVGLVHMDIKPSNVLLDADGQPKLIDFGAAQFRMRVKELGLVGTPFYIAPETVQKKIPTFKSDMYGLGATMFHILAGRPPFKGANPKETIALRLHRSAPLLHQFCSWIHPQTERVVARMMEIDPEKRHRTYDELVEALDEALQAAAPRTAPMAAPQAATPFSPPPAPEPAPLAVATPSPPPPSAPDAPAPPAEELAAEPPLPPAPSLAEHGELKKTDDRRQKADRRSTVGRRPADSQAGGMAARVSNRRSSSRRGPMLVIAGVLMLALLGIGGWAASQGRSTASAGSDSHGGPPRLSNASASDGSQALRRPVVSKQSGRSQQAGASMVGHWDFASNLFGIPGGAAQWLGEPGRHADGGVELTPQQRLKISEPLVRAAKGMSIALWIKVTELAEGSGHPLLEGAEGSPVRLDLADGRPRLQLGTDYEKPSEQNGGTLDPDFDLADHVGQWVHLAVTYDSASRAVAYFINGRAHGTLQVQQGVAPDVGPLLVGMPGSGVLRDLRIYDQAISAEEVAKAMQDTDPVAAAKPPRKGKK